MAHNAKTITSSTPLRVFVEWSRQNRLVSVALLGVIVVWLIYSWFGRSLIQDMYAGTSWEFMNRIIRGQSIYDLHHYYALAETMLFGYGVMFLCFLAFFSSLWSGRQMRTGRFVFLLVLLSLSNIAFVLPAHDFGALILQDDHPKFFSISVENAHALMRHGSPFGFNHYFQGGIPAFYLRTCFLPLIPFSSILGDQVGYRAMLIVFLTLIPVSLFFLIREITENQTIAQVVAFMGAFQLGSLEYLYYGMTPAVLAISLSFLCIFFMIKYTFSGNSRLWCFAALLTSTVLLYTHVLYFSIVWIVYAGILLWVAATGGWRSALTRFGYLAALSFLTGLPFLVSFVEYSSFFKASPEYASHTEAVHRISNMVDHLLENIRLTGSLSSLLLPSTLFVLALFAQSSEYRHKLLFKKIVLVSAAVLLCKALEPLPKVSIFAARILAFAPFLVVLNAALALTINLNRRTRTALVFLILTLVLSEHRLHTLSFKTVKTFSEVDPKLNEMIFPGDHVLFENFAHFNPFIDKEVYKRPESQICGHWLTYIQRAFGIRFFSNIGEDPHPYNTLRGMYVVNGTYLGRPLEGEIGASLVKRLEAWDVNKVCVWSEPAKAYFGDSEKFRFLADSEKYRCYLANYERAGEVRFSGAGTGKIVEETAFSFTVSVANVSQPQTVTVAKNFFPSWSAYDGEGRKIPLNKQGQMISFDVDRDGLVHFKFRKHTFLNVAAVLGVLLPLVFYPRRQETAGLDQEDNEQFGHRE